MKVYGQVILNGNLNGALLAKEKTYGNIFLIYLLAETHGRPTVSMTLSLKVHTVHNQSLRRFTDQLR